MRRSKASWVAALLACALGLVVLAGGCDASDDSTSTAGGVAGGVTEDHGGANAAAAPLPSAAASAAGRAAGSAPSAAPSGGTQAPPILANRDVIYTADITVRTTNIEKAVAAVESLVTTKGGVVYAEQVDLTPKDPGNPGKASATVTLKVPPERLAETLDAVGAIGVEVSRDENSDDVTSQVVDVNARIQAAQASIARLTDLLAHTGSVADLLNVENQLSQRDADLESLEQQQKALGAQTSQATITVHLQATPPVAVVTTPTKHAHVFGFLRGLRGGWHAFTATVAAVATGVGASLPFLIVVAILGIAAVFGRRRILRARAANRPPTSVEPS